MRNSLFARVSTNRRKTLVLPTIVHFIENWVLPPLWMAMSIETSRGFTTNNVIGEGTLMAVCASSACVTLRVVI